jgi:hypothetical protein
VKTIAGELIRTPAHFHAGEISGHVRCEGTGYDYDAEILAVLDVWQSETLQVFSRTMPEKKCSQQDEVSLLG